MRSIWACVIPPLEISAKSFLISTCFSPQKMIYFRSNKDSNMNQKDLLNRITVNPKVLVGKPTIRGLRISVEQILNALAAGVPEEDLLKDYPELEADDIRAALAYAASVMA
jgi:uncharacterized protein (DUF433 family)